MRNFKIEINGNMLVKQDGMYYKSNVHDVEEGYVLIDIPVNNGIYLTLNKDEELELEYYADGGNYYRFNSKILDRTSERNLNFYKLSSPYNVVKIQRRNFVRVNMVEYAFYKIQTDEGQVWHKGLLKDLSGGGMMLKVREKINLHDKLTVNLFLDNSEKVEVECEAVRVVKDEDKEYVCGLRFLGIQERVRDKIIQKVFEQMRKQRELV